MQRRGFLSLLVVLLFTIGVLPVLSMWVKSVMVDGRFSLAAYEDVLASRHQWTLMGHSMALSLLVTVLAVAAGTPLGILLGKTDLPFRRFFTALFVIPLLIPPYIIAVAWSDLLGASSAHLLFGLPGCVLVLFPVFLPVPMLLTILFLRAINPRLEEAGLLVIRWRGVLKGISLPLIFPAVMLSAMLIFLLVFGEFSVPNYLRFDVFPVESFTQFSAFYNFKAATAAAVPLVAVTLVLLFAEAFFLRERTYQLRPLPEAEPLPPIQLGCRRGWWFTGVLLAGLLLVVVPIAALAVQSIGAGVYAEAFSAAGDSLLRSLLYAAIGATLLSLLGFFTGYLIHTKAFRFWPTVDSVTLFLFALPSTVIGIGLISLWNTPWTNLVYSTPVIILLGYLAKYTALTSRISVTQLAYISPTMEEAAQITGAGWFRRMVYIVMPMARRGLLGGWMVGYIFSLRDTGITMLVYPAGHETLPVRIFTLMANGSAELIAALCMIMIAATLLPIGILWMILNPIKGKTTE